MKGLRRFHAPAVAAVDFQQEGLSVGDLKELCHIGTEGITAEPEEGLAQGFQRAGSVGPEFTLP